MDATFTVTHAWQRMRRQSLLPAGPAVLPGAESSFDEWPADVDDTRPMLYRSEAFAEDLFES